jgi:hypothetical protein
MNRRSHEKSEPAGPVAKMSAAIVHRSSVDEWIERNAAALAQVLGHPPTRARVFDLMTGVEDHRQRRLAELAAELDSMEPHWREEEP